MIVKLLPWEGSIDFTFTNGPAVISVPIPQIVGPSCDNDDDDEEDNDDNNGGELGETCLFGLRPLGDLPFCVLGTTFLTSTFTCYNLDDQTVGFAQAAWV